MGQKIGKALFVDDAKVFLNMRAAMLQQLWEAFNDIADGFGLTVAEFQVG